MIDIQKEVKVTVFFIFQYSFDYAYRTCLCIFLGAKLVLPISCFIALLDSHTGRIFLWIQPCLFAHLFPTHDLRIVHHFFLIFCMTLDGYKVRKVTKCNFCKKVLWHQERPKHPQTEVFRLLTKIKFICMYF